MDAPTPPYKEDYGVILEGKKQKVGLLVFRHLYSDIFVIFIGSCVSIFVLIRAKVQRKLRAKQAIVEVVEPLFSGCAEI